MKTIRTEKERGRSCSWNNPAYSVEAVVTPWTPPRRSRRGRRRCALRPAARAAAPPSGPRVRVFSCLVGGGGTTRVLVRSPGPGGYRCPSRCNFIPNRPHSLRTMGPLMSSTRSSFWRTGRTNERTPELRLNKAARSPQHRYQEMSTRNRCER